MDSLVNDLIKPYLSENTQQKVTALFGGGFKPPTLGHLKVILEAIKNNPEINNIIVFVGGKERDGITQDKSFKIWEEHYKDLIPLPTTFIKSSAPVGDIYRQAKNNPEEEFYWLIGAREEREDDLKDISSRSKSISKYPNLYLKPITTSDGGMSGTNARKALQMGDKEGFKFYLPIEVDHDAIWNILTSDNLNENIGFDNFDYPKHLKSLTEFMLDVGLEINPLPSVKFINDDVDNANNFFGKTAYYDPNSHRITLYTLNRHPKDVMRSFAHEMIHHHQNCQNRLGNITTTNTTEDSHLEDLEKEAYQKGNICFRNWTDTITENIIKEGKYDKMVNVISSRIFQKWKNEFNLDDSFEDNKEIAYHLQVDHQGMKFDVEAILTLIPELDDLQVEETTGAGTDEQGDFFNIHFLIDPEWLPKSWEEVSMLLKDTIRHEIEHLTHNIGAKSNIPIKSMMDDSLIRTMIRAGILPQSRYLKLDKEIDANLQGHYFRAKKEKKPFKDVVNSYLDAKDLSPEEKEEILDLWRKRAKQLSLPKL